LLDAVGVCEVYGCVEVDFCVVVGVIDAVEGEGGLVELDVEVVVLFVYYVAVLVCLVGVFGWVGVACESLLFGYLDGDL
jgi:hypothetical protein